MKTLSLCATLAAVLLLGGMNPAAAQSAGGLTVTEAWARSVSHGVANGAIYFTITNGGKTADTLLSAATDVAARAEIHETRITQGMMQMRPLGPLALAPGDTVQFAPGGKHVMLMGLKQPLTAGDTHRVTLTFAQAGPVTVTFTVRDATGMGGSHGMGGGHGNAGSGKGMAMPKQN
jgi:hypothetical protein